MSESLSELPCKWHLMPDFIRNGLQAHKLTSTYDARPPYQATITSAGLPTPSLR